MRTCSACQAPASGDATRCEACGASLPVLAAAGAAAISLSETVPHAARSAGGRTPSPAASGAAIEILAEAELDPADPPEAPDTVIGTHLAGRYEVTRKIGEGGMGAVYEARHLVIGKRVAIKVLLDKYAQKADVTARFLQEARLASSIGHEHIVDITDFGETDDGRTFIVMEYLEGDSLAQLLLREGPIPAERAIGIARQVASALGAAHDKGIVHRDVKPENVFLVRRGERDVVKVLDFGISKVTRPLDAQEGGASTPRLTQTGMVLGTPLYMSPEQARGEEVLDHRIDVYALGVILYEMATGEVPFQGPNYLSVISQVLAQEPRRPTEVRPDLGIPPALEAVILRAMAKDPATRYPSMAALDDDLTKIERGAAIAEATGRHLSSPGEVNRRPRRWRTLVWFAGVGAIVATVATIIARQLPERPAGVVVNVQAAPNATRAGVAPEPEIARVRVTIASTPPGAEVFRESVSRGKTPVTLELPKGKDELRFTLKLEGHKEASAPFVPFQDDTLQVKLEPLPAAPEPALMDGGPGEADPAGVTPAEGSAKPGEAVRPGEAVKPAEAKPAEAKPAEAKPGGRAPAETKPRTKSPSVPTE